MINAHFEGKKMIIELSSIDKKYLCKKMHFKLMYGIELTNGKNEIYEKAGDVEFEYNGEEKVEIEVEQVETGYRGEKIRIGYCIEAGFGSKRFIFRDKKDIDISGRENQVYHVSDLKKVKSGVYRDYTDKKDRMKIIKKVFRSFVKNFLMLIPNIFKHIKGWGLMASIIVFPFILALIVLFALILIESYSNALTGVVIYTLIIFFGSYIHYSHLGLILDYKDGFDSNKNMFDSNKNISEFLSGKATKNIENIDVQIFGINEERGWYDYNCGSSTCTTYINHEVANVLLFSKKISKIATGENIGKFLNEKLDLEKMYLSLFPEQDFGEDMGLFTLLEFRIISDDYSDEICKRHIKLNKDKFKKLIKMSDQQEGLHNGKDNSDFFV